MSQLAPHLTNHSAYLRIEDQLDALGQRYRVQKIVRGALLWLTSALLASLAAALLSHWIVSMWPETGRGHGSGILVTIVLVCWIAWMAVSAIGWVLKPLLLRPRNLDVARLVESRVDGLNNGLTNSLLLARARDLTDSPWLPAIFEEIAQQTQGRPLNEAVKFSDLKKPGIVAAAVILPILLLTALPGFRQILFQGARQMFNPGTFVPQAGSVEDLHVEPGDVMVIAGQPLEISISAHSKTADFQPEARIIFDPSGVDHNGKQEAERQNIASLTPTVATDAQEGGVSLKYAYRIDRVDEPTRYRVEIAGRHISVGGYAVETSPTQSEWYSVKVVQQIKLRELSLLVTPPTYTRQPAGRLSFKGDEIAKALSASPISVPQGSRVELSVLVDVPVKGAMLQIGDGGQAAMAASQGNLRFTAETTVVDQTSLSVLLTEGPQVIARLPENGVPIQCVKDAPPTIELQWPAHDVTVAPNTELKIHFLLKDDYGLTSAQILMAPSGNAEQSLTPVWSQQFNGAPPSAEITQTLDIKPELRKHGESIRVQVSATDNRDLVAVLKAVPAGAVASKDSTKEAARDSVDGGPQTTTSSIIEIKFRDPAQIAAEEKEKNDLIRAELMKMLVLQKDLNSKAVAFAGDGKEPPKDAAKKLMVQVNGGQTNLRSMMQRTADTFSFDDATRIVQKTLLMMTGSVAREAVELSAAILAEPVVKEEFKEGEQLQGRQRQIIDTLESLLAVLSGQREATSQPTVKGSPDMPNQAEKWEKLNEALKAFMKEEQRILDQTASLARKPVDNFDDKDKQLLEQLKQSQDKMDAFMQQALSDFSKNAEQDMSNAALLKDLMSVYSEVTMAKDALKQQSAEIAVADEEMGLEGAKEISSNIEKWLSNQPDRAQWTQEDPVAKTDTPMPELPKELEDMVGKLMEEQEDLNQEMEDANANWTDSMDKGVGWDAADGPIADMSAKGVTGNTLPNDNEMAGRSGEGRSGKSQGEFVGDTAQGKGGRNTPTRLDPTPFAKGQIKDESKDPVGGATGGGKLSGQGAAGLEGPVPPKQKEEMQRLADKQAQVRNQAERLQLQYHLGRYDNFNLFQSIALMRRTESDLRANRYQNAMRNRDVIVDDVGASRLLLGGALHVQQDTTPVGNAKMQEEINDAMKGDLPAAWSDALKEYYKKLSAE